VGQFSVGANNDVISAVLSIDRRSDIKLRKIADAENAKIIAKIRDLLE